MIKLVSKKFEPIENTTVDFGRYTVFSSIESTVYNDFIVNFLYNKYNREDIIEINSAYKSLAFEYTNSTFYSTMKDLISYGTYHISVNDKYIYDKFVSIEILV